MQEILNDYGKSGENPYFKHFLSGVQGLYSLDGSSHQPKTYPATAPSSPPSMRLDIGDDSDSDSDMGSEAYRGDDRNMDKPWEENTETTSTNKGKDQNTEILYLDQAKVFYTERSSSRTTKGKGGHANQMLEAADKMSLPQRSSSQGPNTVLSDDAASNPMAPPLEKLKRGRGSRGGKSTTQSKGRKTSSEQPPTPKSLPTISPTTVSPTSGYPPPLPSMGRQVPLPSKAPISEAIRRKQSDINHNQFNSSFFRGWTTQDFSNSVVTVPGGNAPLGLEENRTNLHLPDDIWGGGSGETQGVEDFSQPFAPQKGNLGYRSTGPSDVEPSYNNQYGWGQRGNYRESYENYGADNRGGGYRRNYHEGNLGMQGGGYDGNLGNQGRDYGGSYGGSYGAFYREGYKGPDSGYGGYNRGLYQNFERDYPGGRGYDHFSQSHSLQGFIKDDRGIKGLEVAESARTGFQEATHLGTAQASEVAQRGVSSIIEKLREPTAEGRSLSSLCLGPPFCCSVLGRSTLIVILLLLFFLATHTLSF
ncbi:hypothetical protein GG344DRAFT_83096 [Lentinula edodes]|nr:hypothetical protein GG344DRAFT_83096 [Lentinula edodes]